MDFFVSLNGRSATVKVFQPDWRTLDFLVEAGPFQYRGHYVVGVRHVSAQMMTLGRGPPQRVQVSIDLESLSSIAMTVITQAEDGRRRSMVFAYSLRPDRLALEFDLTLPRSRRGVRGVLRRTRDDWSAASVELVLAVDEINHLSARYDFGNGSVKLRCSTMGPLVPDVELELRKSSMSAKAMLRLDRVVHEMHASADAMSPGRVLLDFGLQSPLLPVPPLTATAAYTGVPGFELVQATALYGNMQHAARAQMQQDAAGLTVRAALDTQLFGLRDVHFVANMNNTDSVRTLLATLRAFGETSELEASSTFVAPYEVHVNLNSRRLPAGNAQLFGVLDAHSRSSFLANASLVSGNHESAVFFRYRLIDGRSLNNSMAVRSTVWPVHFKMDNFIEVRDGFRAQSQLTSSVEVVPHYNVAVEMVPSSTYRNLYQLRGHFTTPVTGVRDVKLEGLVPRQFSLVRKEHAFVSLRGAQDDIQMHLDYNHSSHGDRKISCSLLLPGAAAATTASLRLGSEWSFYLASSSPFEDLLPRLVHFSTDKKSKVTAKIEQGSKTFHMEGNVQNRSDLRAISFNLLTPFQNYEEFGIVGRLETGERKGVQAEVTYLGKTAGIKADFFLDGFNIIARVSLQTPFDAFSGFEIDVTNLLDLAELTYDGRIAGRFGSYEVSATVKASYQSLADAYLEISGKVGAQFISNKFSVFEKDRKLEISNKLKTSSRALQSLYLAGFNDKSTSAFHVGLSCDLNSASVIRISCEGPVDNFRLEFENPWQPIGVEWFYAGGKTTIVGLQGTWNFQEPKHSKTGVNITYRTEPTDMLLRLETLAFKKSVSLEGKLGKSSTKFHVSTLLRLDGNPGIGYEISYRDSSRITLARYSLQGLVKLPTRVLSLTGNHRQSDGNAKTEAGLKWDAENSPEKKMSAFVDFRTDSIWDSWQSRRYNVTIGVTHSALDHDVVLDSSVQVYAIDRSLKATSVLRYTKEPEFNLLVDAAFVNRSSAAVQHYDLAIKGRQAVSGLNATLASSTVFSQSLMAQNVSFAYRNKLSEVEAFRIQAEMDKPQRRATARLVTRTHDASLRGSHQMPAPGVHLLRLESDFDGVRRPLQLRVQTRSPTRPLEVSLDATYERNRKLFLYAGQPTSRLISVSASRNLYGMQVRDASLHVRLNSSRLLSVVVQWRWQIAVDVKRRAVARFTALSADARSWLADMTRFVRDEAARKERFIQPVLNRKWAAVAAYTRAEYRAVAGDLLAVRDEWSSMYLRDDFFMRTIYGVVQVYLQRGRDVLNNSTTGFQKAISAIKSLLANVSEDVSLGYRLLVRAVGLFSSAVQGYVVEEIVVLYSLAMEIREASQLLLDTIQGLADVIWSSVTSLASSAWEVAASAGSRLLAALRFAISPVVDSAGVVVSWVVQQSSQAISYVTSGISEINAQMKDSLFELAGAFTTQLLDIFYLNNVDSSMPEWISFVPGLELLSTIAATGKDIIYFAYDGVVTFLQYNQEFLQEVWLGATSLMSQVRDAVPPVRILFEWLQRVYSQTSWAWKYWEEGNQIRNAVLWATDSIWGADNASNETAGFKITDNSVLKFFPEDGYVETNLNLPVDWDNFNSVPNFSQEGKAKKEDLSFDVTFFYYELLDFINKVYPLFTVSLWLPPYDTHALIAGSQHYLTFDNKFFEFAGGCSYLLAADLKDLSFALVVNYDVSHGRAVRRSLTVFHGNHTLRLVEAKSLFFNDRRVELPFRLGSTTVSRNGSRTVLDLGHSRIQCNVAFDVCVVQLSGWFHGRTGGLLGTYTNEPADDFAAPSGQVLTRTDSFARMWEVRGDRRSCRVKNLAIRASSGADPSAAAACHALFGDPSSALRPCYGLVDTTPFTRMCLNDLEAHYNSPGRYLTVCTSASAYVAECAAHGVDIWMPPVCVRCELEDGHVLQAAQTTLFRHNAPRFADVVFVVERKSCQRRRSFLRSVQAMDEFLRRRGIVRNRFAIIGYGGDDVYRHPHIETVKGAIWGDSRATGRALDQLAENLSGDSDGPSEVFQAVREACRLPFRGGVSKQIVLLSCSQCPFKEREFPFTLKVLGLMDVKLHIVADTKFRLKKASRQYDARVIALGASAAYTTKDLQSARAAGDSSLRPLVRIPKDLCSPLALETNGTVFDGRRWSKQLRDLLAAVVAEAADPSPCQECDCFADRDGVGKLECRTCISRALQSLLNDFEADFSEQEDSAWFEDYDVSPSVN